MRVSNHYIKGDRLVDCDICGFTYRFSQMRKGVSGKEKGFNVCPECYSPLHPGEIPFTLRPKRPLKKVGE